MVHVMGKTPFQDSLLATITGYRPGMGRIQDQHTTYLTYIVEVP